MDSANILLLHFCQSLARLLKVGDILTMYFCISVHLYSVFHLYQVAKMKSFLSIQGLPCILPHDPSMACSRPLDMVGNGNLTEAEISQNNLS